MSKTRAEVDGATWRARNPEGQPTAKVIRNHYGMSREKGHVAGMSESEYATRFCAAANDVSYERMCRHVLVSGMLRDWLIRVNDEIMAILDFADDLEKVPGLIGEPHKAPTLVATARAFVGELRRSCVASGPGGEGDFDDLIRTADAARAARLTREMG
jgi:hypothetical protein